MCVFDGCSVWVLCVLCVQFGENRRVLQVVRTLLEEFREELREEEARRCQLQQSYANDKAAWEVKWAEMKCQVAQVQMASQHPPLKGQNTIWLLEKPTSGTLSKQQVDSKHVAFCMGEVPLRATNLFLFFFTCKLSAALRTAFNFESPAMK